MIASVTGEGEEFIVELEQTPFYPEGGGQVGDVGTLVGNTGRGTVKEVRWLGGSKIAHRVVVTQGSLKAGEGVVARVDVAKRKSSQRNHTATHLLHAALRSVLGGHVRQSGSLVAPDRLRFDFTHYEPLSDEDVSTIEDIVNSRVLDNIPVRASMEAFEDAKARGAIALFGDKYGQQVRMVDIDQTSCELCGGTHVGSTGEIGGFRILSESGIAAGVRRIEAATGEATIAIGRDATRELEHIASILKVPVHDLGDGARKTIEKVKALEKEISELRQRLAGSEVDDILTGVKDVDGIKVVGARVEAPSVEILKHLTDKIKERLPEGVVCVGSAVGDRAIIVVGVDPALAKEKGVKASLIAKKLGEMVGGKGGGKDTFAQAGGKNVDKLDAALEQCAEVVAGLVK